MPCIEPPTWLAENCWWSPTQVFWAIWHSLISSHVWRWGYSTGAGIFSQGSALNFQWEGLGTEFACGFSHVVDLFRFLGTEGLCRHFLLTIYHLGRWLFLYLWSLHLGRSSNYSIAMAAPCHSWLPESTSVKNTTCKGFITISGYLRRVFQFGAFPSGGRGFGTPPRNSQQPTGLFVHCDNSRYWFGAVVMDSGLPWWF